MTAISGFKIDSEQDLHFQKYLNNLANNLAITADCSILSIQDFDTMFNKNLHIHIITQKPINFNSSLVEGKYLFFSNF